jgi:hypothetical protein
MVRGGVLLLFKSVYILRSPEGRTKMSDPDHKPCFSRDLGMEGKGEILCLSKDMYLCIAEQKERKPPMLAD